MRILQVVHSMDPRSGGPTAVVSNTARSLQEASHDVSILTTTVQSSEPWVSPAEHRDRVEGQPGLSGVKIHWVNAWGRRGIWQRYAYGPSAHKSLRAIFHSPEKRPHVVHINGTFSHLTQQAAAAARRYSVPYIVTPMGSLSSLCLARGNSMLKRLFIRAFLERDLQHAATVQATCEHEALNVANLNANCRIDVVPHGVSLPSGDDWASRDIFLSQFPQLRGKRFVLFLSRVHPIKRLDLLIRAFSSLGTRFPELLLVVAGNDSGALQGAKDLIHDMRLEEKVLFTGFLAADSKRGALEAADVFALPSEHENFGVAVVEAMAHGVPTIVTKGVAAHDYVDASGCGYTVDSTPDAIAEGLQRVLLGGKAHYGGRGRQFVIDHLTWSRVSQILTSMYQDAVSARGDALSDEF